MNILVIAAHPDDEVIGCGGTLHKLSKKPGNKIFIAIAADGVLGRQKGKIDFDNLPENIHQEIEARKKGAREVARGLKAEILNLENQNFNFNFVDQRLDSYPIKDIIDWVQDWVKKTKPDIIYTHFIGDLNSDHRLVGEATLVAARPKEDFIKAVYAYEVSVTIKTFTPNVFEKIDLKAKIKMFESYQTEKGRSSRWEEIIEPVARYRGLQGGFDCAEAFMLLRQRND